MSQYASVYNRGSRVGNDTVMEGQNEEDSESQERYISVTQKYSERLAKLQESQKNMDMVYNYMVKNGLETEKKGEAKEEKVRKTRKDKEGRKFICGACKLGYLSYPALYTHIKTKHKGETPEGTIRGESGKPKKRGRPKVRKTPQIYERQLQRTEFPAELSGLVTRENLEVLEQFEGIEAQNQQTEITLKYFVGLVRQLKKVGHIKVCLLPIHKVITTFLDNTKLFINDQTMQDFEQTFYDLIVYTNRNHAVLLRALQNISSYYVNSLALGPGQQYCDHQLPTYLPLFVYHFIRTELTSEDEMEQAIMYDFCKWLLVQKLTDLKLARQGGQPSLIKRQQQ